MRPRSSLFLALFPAVVSLLVACGSGGSVAGGDDATEPAEGASDAEASRDASGATDAGASLDAANTSDAGRAGDAGKSGDAGNAGDAGKSGDAGDAGHPGSDGGAGGGAAISFGAGGTNTCAVCKDHTLYCWGQNDHGQVGDGSMTMRTAPVAVAGLGANVTAVAVGENNHSCALLDDGTVRCWGWNAFGALGDGTANDSATPVAVSGLTNVVEVRAGSEDTCARKSDGTVWCWGENDEGELGDGTKTQRSSPVQVTAIGTSAAQVDLGWFHTCVRRTDGTVACWGRNSYGMLGDGTFVDSATPVTVVGLSNVTAISTGPYTACARLASGALSCWGNNRDGEMNDGTMNDYGAPVGIAAMGTNVAIADQGFSAAFALKNDGTVWYWGYDTLTGVTQVPGIVAKAIAAGDDHTCAIDNAGSLECWGYNGSGELGDGTTTSRPTPAVVNLPCAP